MVETTNIVVNIIIIFNIIINMDGSTPMDIKESIFYVWPNNQSRPNEIVGITIRTLFAMLLLLIFFAFTFIQVSNAAAAT